MTDRQWFGDLSLAVLLAHHLLALARPQPDDNKVAPAAVKLASADRVPMPGRIGLLS